MLAFETVSKRFGSVVAVRELTASIDAGEYFCILGPSGCGKTTLLRLVAGFEDPTDGRILLDGRVLNGVPPEKRDVNIVFQSYALFPHLSVFENIAFGLRARRTRAGTVRQRVQEALALVRLEQEAARLPRELSGGQQQRVALARALVMQPRVLLLDEPLSALDRHLRLAMQEELRRVHKETGLTFVHITHDQAEALALGERVAVMRAGAFVQVDPPDVLYRRPTHRFVAEFVGSSNVLNGQLESTDPPQIRIGDVLLHADALPTKANGPVVVSIRPEALHLDGRPNGPNAFRAKVRSVVFAGAVLEITLAAGRSQWLAHLPARATTHAIEHGEEVIVSVDPQDITIIGDA